MCATHLLLGVFWLRNTHPTQVPSSATNTAWASIGAGITHTCAARLDDGTAECWGSNSKREATPRGGVSFGIFSGGYLFTCGTSRDTGFPVCFGDDANAKVSGAPSTTSLSAIASGCAFCYATTTQNARISFRVIHSIFRWRYDHTAAHYDTRNPSMQTRIPAALLPLTTPSSVGAKPSATVPRHPLNLLLHPVQ